MVFVRLNKINDMLCYVVMLFLARFQQSNVTFTNTNNFWCK